MDQDSLDVFVLGKAVNRNRLGKIVLVAIIAAYRFSLKRANDGLRDVHAVFRNMERVLHDLKILIHHHDTPVVDIRNGLDFTI